MEEKRWALGIEGLEKGMPDNLALGLINNAALKPIKREKVVIDPFKYEAAKYHIHSMLMEGCFALVRTSGSPIVTDVGEYVSGILDADGNTVCISTGVLIHVTGGESYIRVIKFWYEDDPGIFPGDQFVLNGPYIGGLHPMDIAICKPVFHGDEIIAWVQSITHCMDVGAAEAGTFAPNVTNVFQEGFSTSGLKIINKGRPDPMVFKTYERAVRDAQLIHLDLNSKIAHNNVVSALVEDLLEREGPEFFKALMKKMIYDTEDKCREKVRRIPDGKWRYVQNLDTDGLVPTPDVKVDVTLEKKGDKLIFDMSNSSPQSPCAVNSAIPATIGCIFSITTSLFFWDVKPWNKGISTSLELINPKGTIFNPAWPAASMLSAITSVGTLGAVLTQLLSRANICGGFEEDACGHWMTNADPFTAFGMNQYGRLSVAFNMDEVMGGSGATKFLDGDDTAVFLLAIGTMGADVETWESRDPFLFLYRRRRADSFGHGMRRGGAGGEELFVVHKAGSPQRCHFATIGRSFTTASGTFGGYPADTIDIKMILDADPRRLSTQEYSKILERAYDYEAIGKVVSTALDSIWMQAEAAPNGAMIYKRWHGGGGYGDPVKRETDLVRKDVLSGMLSEKRAREIYGVVLDPVSRETDQEETQRLRQQIVSDRKKAWEGRG